ncbi:MAG: BtrH N-terminal domain-containing protein [Solirubrobacteraceae bacterium]|nr:BtrH N-terminal domain-containing protein [Solirubrobacteraceae bacterium]
MGDDSGSTTSATPTARARAFPHRTAGHCGSGALRDLLEFHGLDYDGTPLSEAMVFGLSGGYGFFYGDEVPGVPFYLVGRSGSMELDVAGHLGATVELRQTDDPDEGWAWTRAAIDRGAPPMVWADIGELEYLRVRMSNTRHDIVIVDYDDGEDVAWIADNDREELQLCSLESLRRARNSPAFPGPNRNATFEYDWPTELPPLREAFRGATSTALENMRGGADAVGDLGGHTGLAGVDHLAQAFPQWPAMFGDGLPVILDVLRVLIVKAGTGGAMFRSLQAEFLEETAALLEDAEIAATAGVVRRLSDAWEHLAVDAAGHDHTAANVTLQEIRRLEHDAVAALERHA